MEVVGGLGVGLRVSISGFDGNALWNLNWKEGQVAENIWIDDMRWFAHFGVLGEAMNDGIAFKIKINIPLAYRAEIY